MYINVHILAVLFLEMMKLANMIYFDNKPRLSEYERGIQTFVRRGMRNKDIKVIHDNNKVSEKLWLCNFLFLLNAKYFQCKMGCKITFVFFLVKKMFREKYLLKCLFSQRFFFITVVILCFTSSIYTSTLVRAQIGELFD